MNTLPKLPASERISVKNGAQAQYDDDGRMKVRKVRCGSCGRVWNDALITGRTPAPSARCPYEYFHRPEVTQ